MMITPITYPCETTYFLAPLLGRMKRLGLQLRLMGLCLTLSCRSVSATTPSAPSVDQLGASGAISARGLERFNPLISGLGTTDVL